MAQHDDPRINRSKFTTLREKCLDFARVAVLAQYSDVQPSNEQLQVACTVLDKTLTELVEWVCTHPGVLDLFNDEGHTPLIEAITHGPPVVVSRLLRLRQLNHPTINPNTPSRDGVPPIVAAIRSDWVLHESAPIPRYLNMAWLLEAKADPYQSETTGKKQHALTAAASKPDHRALVMLLLNYRCDATRVDGRFNAVLRVLVHTNQRDLLQYVLRMGVDTSFVSDHDKRNFLTYLVSHGYHPALKDVAYTVSKTQGENMRKENRARLEKLCANVLQIVRGADVQQMHVHEVDISQADGKGDTPLMLALTLAVEAVENNQSEKEDAYLETALNLIDAGAAVDGPVQDSKFTPMTFCVYHNMRQMLDVMLRRKVNIDHEDGFDRTPLMTAMRYKRDAPGARPYPAESVELRIPTQQDAIALAIELCEVHHAYVDEATIQAADGFREPFKRYLRNRKHRRFSGDAHAARSPVVYPAHNVDEENAGGHHIISLNRTSQRKPRVLSEEQRRMQKVAESDF
jgi:ankyrin repeat protein